MTIEMSPPSTEVKPPASETKANKSTAKSTAAGQEKAAPANGFQAILSALDSNSGATAQIDLPQEAPVAVSAVLVTGDPALSSLEDEGAMDANSLLAQSLQWLTPETALSSVAVDLENASSEGDLSLPLLVPNSGLEKVDAVVNPLLPGLTATQSGLQGHTLELAPDVSRKAPKVKPDLASTQAQTDSAPLDGSVSAGRTLPDPKALVIQQKLESLPTTTWSTTVASGVTSTLGREELSRDRSIFKSLISDTPQPQAMSLGTPIANAGSAQPVSLAPQEMYVAEQVKYWISNDVQSAEMKLDGLGDNPVEVSISMHGNEAQVSFRTDEQQAREALENASVELKGLLQREGLVLTGVSVGGAGSGAGDSGAQERKSRQGAKQAIVAVAQPLSNGDSSISNRSPGRTLDIFV